MGKMKLAALFAIAALLIVAFPAAADNGNGEDPWLPPEGYPDPYECADFNDCFWTVLVCIDGVTYEVGIYFDPKEATAEDWEELEEIYGLLPGACAGPSEDKPVIPMMWLLTRGAPGDWPPCILISETPPSRERQMALCFSNQAVWEPLGYYDPNWVADNAPCAGPVSKSSDHRGSWVCDGVMHTYHGARLPLFSEDGGGGKGTLYAVYGQHLQHIDG